MYTAILADRDPLILSTRKERLEAEFKNLKIVAMPRTAGELVKATLDNRPDLIISAVNLTESYALDALQSIKSHKLYPKIILHSPFISTALSKKSMSVGADFYMLEPFSKSQLHSMVADVLDYNSADYAYIFSKEDHALVFKDSIKVLLYNLGFKPNIFGTRYLTDAIASGLMNIELTESVTKILYPFIAKKHNSSGDKIERSIRHALSTTYEQNQEKFEEILNYEQKPTNSNFIKRCMEYIKENRHDY